MAKKKKKMQVDDEAGEKGKPNMEKMPGIMMILMGKKGMKGKMRGKK